jgi:hypothetical protein
LILEAAKEKIHKLEDEFEKEKLNLNNEIQLLKDENIRLIELNKK